MISLDDFERCWPGLDENARRFLSPLEWEEYNRIPQLERQNQLRALLQKPIARFSPVNEVFFRARWAEALQRIHPGPGLRLLEVATGDAAMIPQAMQRSHPLGHYVSANQNERLNHSFLKQTAALSLDIQLVAADAAEIETRAGADAFDIIAFQHGLNDVVQAILCQREGIDTVSSDWMETLPRMIAILQAEIARGTLEQNARLPFLHLIQVLLGVLKPNGVIAANHYQFQLDLDWGYPPDLWENFVPMIRAWVKDLPGCREIYLDGFHPQWWLFLEKD